MKEGGKAFNVVIEDQRLSYILLRWPLELRDRQWHQCLASHDPLGFRLPLRHSLHLRGASKPALGGFFTDTFLHDIDHIRAPVFKHCFL